MKALLFRVLVMLTWAVIAVSQPQIAYPCKDFKLNGKFGYAATGLVPQILQGGTIRYDATSSIGIVTYDGNGHVAAQTGVQFRGKYSSSDLVGTYSVTEQCVGEAVFKDAQGNEITHWHFIVVDSGREIDTIALWPRNQQQQIPNFSLVYIQRGLTQTSDFRGK